MYVLSRRSADLCFQRLAMSRQEYYAFTRSEKNQMRRTKIYYKYATRLNVVGDSNAHELTERRTSWNAFSEGKRAKLFVREALETKEARRREPEVDGEWKWRKNSQHLIAYFKNGEFLLEETQQLQLRILRTRAIEKPPEWLHRMQFHKLNRLYNEEIDEMHPQRNYEHASKPSSEKYQSEAGFTSIRSKKHQLPKCSSDS